MSDPIACVPSIVASVSVPDLNAALAWYQEKLDLKLNYSAEEVGWAEMATAVDNFTLGISATGAESPGTNVIITLGVAELEATKATLESRGVEFVGEIDEMPGMVKLATFKDLAGNTFMLAQSLMG